VSEPDPPFRIAALYDIHGNLPALEAALQAVHTAGADVIVAGGDMVLGPMPCETLDALLALTPRVRFLRGNCDRLVVDAFDGRSLAHLPPSIRETITWTAAQLSRDHRDFLAALPTTLMLDAVGHGAVQFCHATPRCDEEIFTCRSSPHKVVPMFAGVAERTIVCGHTHIQFDRRIDPWRVINAGSVGMPCGVPGAHWLLLGPTVDLFQTEYDVIRAARRIEATGYPGAAEFAERHVLSPPTVEAMLALLEPRSG